MKEQLVIFDTAKLAQEKGFPQRNNDSDMHSGYIVGACWVSDIGGGKQIFHNSNAHASWAAPTQGLLQKWLRDEKSIDIEVATTFSRRYSCMGYKGAKPVPDFSTDDFDTYEQALEVGLIESLKLIQK